MHRARLLWTPFPYRCALCVTDDTDGLSLEQMRLVYEFLISIEMVTTKSVWVAPASEPSGIPPVYQDPGISLEDTGYLEYCRRLSELGYEICLHGPSAGNSRREAVQRAFELMHRYFGGSPTYICHSKNAENPYWEAEVARGRVARRTLRMYSRQASLGHVPGSPYFWGDICRREVQQIRLFRTRRPDTLAVNPSMPYHDPAKPFVNSWFSATKLPLWRIGCAPVLEQLKETNGLTVLYQYLIMHIDRRGRLDPRFTKACRLLKGDPEIWIGTVRETMDRLRSMHGVYVIHRRNRFWVVNTGDAPVADIQIEVPPVVKLEPEQTVRVGADGRAVIPMLPPRGTSCFRSDPPLEFRGPRIGKVDEKGRSTIRCSFGSVRVNLGEVPWRVGAGARVEPGSYLFECDGEATSVRPRERLGRRERLRLPAAQAGILLREFGLMGRSIRAADYMKQAHRRMNDYDYW